MMAAAANQVGKVPMRCDGGEGRPAAGDGGRSLRCLAAAMEERVRPRRLAARLRRDSGPAATADARWKKDDLMSFCFFPDYDLMS
jgi:hypothetical protein